MWLPAICPPCQRQLKKRRGRHRRHECAGDILRVGVVVCCRCACVQEAIDRIERNGGFPDMSLTAY